MLQQTNLALISSSLACSASFSLIRTRVSSSSNSRSGVRCCLLISFLTRLFSLCIQAILLIYSLSRGE